MEYERIHKAQTGMISPSKLRMKLIGSHNQKKTDGSNCNSSRTSPSKLEDTEFVKNGLLAPDDDDFGEEVSTIGIPPSKFDNSKQENGNLSHLKDPGLRDAGHTRIQLVSMVDASNSNSVHPVRNYEEENLDYDSTSSFEFHKGERSLHQSITRSLSRPMSSKWNDAEKWIMNRQNVHVSKKTNQQILVNRPIGPNMVRVAPESAAGFDNKPSVKRVDFHESEDLIEVDDMELPCTKSVTEEKTGVSGIRSVSMRDTGTEMTPIPSQDPSRSATPVSSTTPIRSPTSSIPSSPRRQEPVPTQTENPTNSATQNSDEYGENDLSEQEMKLKARREIVALGVQLGKMNIAAWARDGENEKNISGNETSGSSEVEQIEYAKRAAAWEEAEKSKHAARFKQEEIRIQAWESQQKAKLDAEMRKIEAQIEQMKADAQAKMVKKIALARQKSEEKRAVAECRKNQLAEKTTAQAEYIRQTGRIPSNLSICCGWL
ncbi:uncharacterized protein [Primulina huaijiensis]|uniref:uncharacterized protein isoform X1 n=2 Tax=Primulina huaijiensis TaxID=1492673 RepID=UPI003CC78B4B